MAKFDWYQATIPDNPSNIANSLLNMLNGCIGMKNLGKGGNGYNDSVVFLDKRGSELGRMLHGGNIHPNVRSTSNRAPNAAGVIREAWPRHKVTRIDVALDYTGEGVFDHLHALAMSVVDDCHIKTGLMMQPDLLERGRTYRIGSPASPVMVRLYEKGLHEIHKGRNEDPFWTRLELQVRPQKSAKTAFASIEPLEAWGASRWSAKLLKAVLGEEPQRIKTDPRQESEWEETQKALVKQYGRHAIEGGLRACGAPAKAVRTEDAIDAYLEILRQDLLRHSKKKAIERLQPSLPGMESDEKYTSIQ